MDLKREHFRAMIYYDYKSSLKEKQCLQRLKNAFGDLCPSQGTVYNWFREFKTRRGSLEDEDALQQQQLMKMLQKWNKC